MNIESTNLSSITPGTAIVESVSTAPLVDGVVSEGFSEALVAQIELLSNIKAEESLPLQTPDQAVLQSVNSSPNVAELPVTNIDTQDFAALLGNNLPPSYKTKDDVDHEAALAAVTDTLKYINVGTTAEEKVAEVEQNIKDMDAVVVPVEQDAPSEQSAPETVAAVADLLMKDVPVQMNLEQSKDQPEKKNQDETEAPIATAAVDNRGIDELMATVILPLAIPDEQEKPANTVIKENRVLSFVKSSIEGSKQNQTTKVSSDVLQTEAVFRQPDQSKQDFNLKYFGNAGQPEKTIEQQASDIGGEKTLPRIGTDIIQPNKLVIDNKVDVPAITKPLSHPEWNKDMGERIVWMSNKAIPSAEIRLNPQHLGPISVRVDVTDDKATVAFTAQHAVVREALEASIPKLREMMSAQQLNLVDVNVSQGSASDHGRSQSQTFAQTAGGGQGGANSVVNGVDDVEQEIESGRAIVSKGLLSLYA
jgi:flagellar hook-length control protein FliK